MVVFIRSGRKRSLVADILHTLFNVLLAAGVIALTIFFESPWLAVGLVLLSKWRVLAVRPRYWWANLLSSLPDLVVGLSFVMISWSVGQVHAAMVVGGNVPADDMLALIIQVILGVVYAIWLIAIKPQHAERWVLFQAAASQFVGLMALFMMSRGLSLLFVVLGAFVVGFAAARQMLGQYDEKSRGLLSSVWGLMVALLAFVCWHWNVMYLLDHS